MNWVKGSVYHLASDPPGFTIATVILPLSGEPVPMYETWDIRIEPARHLGVSPTADQAKGLAEKVLAP